jgi:subtilase family serine protease
MKCRRKAGPKGSRGFAFFFLPAVVLAGIQTAAAATLHMLPGHMPAAVSSLKPLGRLDEGRELNLTICLPLRNQQELSALLQKISDPASDNYRHYLTADQFAEKFGPTEKDLQPVRDFVRTNGLRITGIHSNRTLINFSGSVRDVERVFHVRFNSYRHPRESRAFYAPDREPSLELSSQVMHIDGLSDYALPRPRIQMSSHIKGAVTNAPDALPNSGSAPNGSYMGSDFRKAYVPDSTLTGTGQVVGLLQFDGYTPADITYYENLAGLPNVPLTNVLLDGYNGVPTGFGARWKSRWTLRWSFRWLPAYPDFWCMRRARAATGTTF